MKYLNRISIISLVLLTSPLVANADCSSDCRSDYQICMSGGNPRSCSVDLSTCTQKCVLHSDRHGAIAYSIKKEGWGYSYDYDSSGQAGRAALQNCRKHNSGADDCRVLITFYNACGALALGDGGTYGAAWGPTKGQAATNAIKECRPYGGRSCKVYQEVCSGARQ